MLDLFRKFWDRAVSEGGVIQGAPFTFAIAVIIATSVVGLFVWKALDWQYASIIVNRDSSIAARDSQIGLLAAQVKDLTDKYEQLKKSIPGEKPADPDAILQMGATVGKAVGAMPDKGNSKVFFRLLNTTGDFDQTKPFLYRDMKLKIVSISSAARASMAGDVRSQFADVVCSILSD